MTDAQQPLNETQEKIEKDVNKELEELLGQPIDMPIAPRADDQSTSLTHTEKAPRLIDTLPEDRKKQAKELAKQIDPGDTDSVLQYGAAAQQKLGEFSHSMLNHVQAQEIGEIGNTLTDLMYRLNEADPKELMAEDRN